MLTNNDRIIILKVSLCDPFDLINFIKVSLLMMQKRDGLMNTIKEEELPP